MPNNQITFESLPSIVKELVDEIGELKNLLKEHISPTPTIQNDNLIGIDEACKILRRKKSTIYHLVRDGELPHYKTGKMLEFRPSELYAWQNSYASYRVKSSEEILADMKSAIKRHPNSKW